MFTPLGFLSIALILLLNNGNTLLKLGPSSPLYADDLQKRYFSGKVIEFRNRNTNFQLVHFGLTIYIFKFIKIKPVMKIPVGAFLVFLLGLIVLSANSVNAQTTITAGTLTGSTSWTQAGSPYIIQGNVLVASTDTLTIQSGVTVRVAGNYFLRVEGTIIAVGTASSTITFESNSTSPTQTSWKGVEIRPSGGSILNNSLAYVSGSRFSYVTIKDAARGIYIFEAGLHIANCTFSNNSKAIEPRKTTNVVVQNSTFTSNNIGVYTEHESYSPDDAYGDISNLHILSNTFQSNQTGAYLFLNQRAFISLRVNGNTFKTNGTGLVFSGGGYGIRLHSAEISSNKFIDNTSSGVSIGQIFGLANGATATYPLLIEKNLFLNNRIGWDLGGGVGGAKTLFTKNLVINPTGDGIVISGGTPAQDLISKNYISSNRKALQLGNSNSNSPTGKSIINNTIFGFSTDTLIRLHGASNILNNNNFKYNTGKITATNKSLSGTNINGNNNFWGTTNSTEINASIYDGVDDPALGNITIATTLTQTDNAAPLFPVRNVIKELVGGQVRVSWTSAIESDLAGYRVYHGAFTGFSYSNNLNVGNTTSTSVAGVTINDDIGVTSYDSDWDGTDDQYDANESWYSAANSIPIAPTNILADSAARRIRLTWTASTSPAVNVYYIYRSLNNASFSRVGIVSSTAFVDSNLTANTRYFYRVTAFDSIDVSYDNFGLESSATAVVTATPSNISYVSNTGNNSNIGSFASPKLTIIHTIDVATSGDSIILFRGQYNEIVDLKGKVALLSSRFIQTGDTADISATIISGVNNGNPMLIQNTATAYTSSMHIYGLTLQDARIFVADLSAGNYSFTYKMSRSIIRNSGQPGTWGVITVGNGGVFDSCVVYGLKGRYILSTGLYNAPSPVVSRSIFYDNSISNTPASSYSGENSVIFVGGTNKARVLGNLIYRNKTSGIHIGGNGGDSMILVNNTVVLNEGYGIRFQTFGGVYTGILINNILAYNKELNLSSNTVTNGPSVYVKNNFLGNTASLAQTGLISPNNTILDTTGNIGGNPYFVDTTANNFRLLAWSPCIASGIVNNYLTTKDILGQPRINTQRSVPDMGAYESSFKFRSPILTKTEPEHIRNVLFWTQSPTTNITGYRIYRSTSPIPDTSTMNFVAQVATPTTLTFIDSAGITNGTTYYYRLKSVDNTSTLSGFSNQLTAIPDSVGVPTSLVLHNSPGRARLSWTSPGNVAKYQVFRGNTLSTRALLADSVLGTTFNDTLLARNTYYLYWVKAMNATGALSQYSDEIQLVPTNTWYVDSTSGNDQTGIGSTALPYRKITKAVANTITSDSVLVRPGTYQETVLIQRPIFLVSTKGPDSTRIFQEPLATTLVTISDPVFNTFFNALRTHVVGFQFVRNPAQNAQSTAIRVERSFSAILRNLFIDSFTFAVSTYYGYYDMYNSVLNNNTHTFGNDVADANRVNNIINSNFINTQSSLTLSNTVVINKFYNSVILNSPNTPFSSTPFSGPKVYFYNSIIDSRLQSYVPETGSTYSYLTNTDSAGFTNTAAKNFRLLNNSQLIGRGGLDFSNTSDFYGNARPQPSGTMPDVGAFESIYGVTASTFNLVEPGNRHVILYWNQVPTTAIAAYKVYRSTAPISDTSSIAPLATVAASLGTAFTDSFGVINNTLYYYRLKAVRNDSLLSGFSIQRTARPDSVGLPTSLALDNSPRFARLTWTGISQANSRYQVYRSLDSLNKTLLADTINALTFTDTSLSRNTVYYYFLRAINSTGALSTYTTGVRLTPVNKWLVDSTLGDNSTGIGSQLAPYRSISTAVNNAITNDTIQVKRGTYTENIFVNGKVLAIFSINGAEQTILVPLQNAPIMRFTNAGPSYVKGFTFANGSPQVPGSAIAETNSNPIITHCIFRNNGAAGGVIITYGGSFELYNSIAYSNTPNTFFELSNTVTAVPKIYHFTYANNSGNFFNAGSGNTVHVPEFRNCIIWQASTPLITGVVSIENSIIKGGFAGSTSNLNLSPSFVDSANNNFQLKNFSRAIGVGLNNLGIVRDFNDSLRPNPAGSNPDLGAFELAYDHPSPVIVSDSSRNGIVSFNWTQTPLSTVNKFYVYKDTVSSSRNLYDSTSLVYTYNDTSNIIFNQVLFYNITSKDTGLFESGFSNQIRTISFTPPTLLFPANSAIGVDTIVTLRWNRIPNATRYYLQLSTDSTFTNSTQQFTVTDTSHTRSGLSGNTMYYWRVQTRDSVRFSSWSPSKKFETFVLPPKLISVRPGNRQDTLVWTNPNSTNITSFKIYRSRDTLSRTLLDTVPSTQLSYIDTSGLILDSTYYYWVTVVNQVGTMSAYSNRLSGTPFNRRPISASLLNKTFNNVGEFNFVRCVYSMSGSVDPDGQIVNYRWYVNDSLISSVDSTLIYYYGRGTNTLKLITIDNDGASDTSTATIILKTFTKQFAGGILGGISAVSRNIIYAADSTYSPITGASIFKLDRLGNTIYPLVVSSKIFTTPSVSSDSSVFITSGSSLNGFNKAGVSLWPTIPLGGLSYVTPTIDSMYKRLYVGISNANFLAVNYLTGTIAWSVFCDAPIKNSAVITGDRKLVFVSQSGRLYGFRIVSDSAQTVPRWSQNLGEIISKSAAVDLNNDLYFGTQSGKLIKLRLLTNDSVQILWSVSLGSVIESSPVIDARGYIYVGANNGKLYKVNPGAGQIMWSRQASGAIKSTPIVTDFGNIVFATMDGSIMAVDSVNNLKWKHKEADPISANLLYIDNIIYAGTQSGAFIGFYDNPYSSTVNTSLSLNMPLRITRERRSSLCNLDGVPIKYVNAFEYLSPIPQPTPPGNPEQPVWGTFQGDFRRTGSRKLDCPERPTINLTGSQSICAGDSIRLVTPNNSNSFWIFNNSNLNIGDTVLYAKQAGVYKRMNTNDNGCNIYSDSLILVVNSLPIRPTVTVNGAQTFCQGTTSQISSSATNNSWYRVGSGNLLSASQTYTVSQSGQYYVRTVNSLGCSSNSDTISFTVYPRPAIPSVTANKLVFCTGDSAELSTNSLLQKQWLNSGIPIANATASTYTVRTAGFYSLTVTDINGCTNSTASFQIIVNSLPRIIVNANPADAIICLGSPITLTATGASTYAWSGGITNGTTFNPPQSGTFVVIGTDINGCSNQSEKTIIVDKPQPSIRYRGVKAIQNTPTSLTARNIGTTYQWLPSSGLNSSIVSNPIFNSSNPQEYLIQIRTGSGCLTTDTLSVYVFKESGIYVPKAFSPNGDGQNERLFPELVNFASLQYFRVYNRWGQLVFETRAMNSQGWDGIFNGVKQPMDTYTWFAAGADKNGKLITANGQTLLIR